MTSLVRSCETQALQSHRTRNFSQSLWRKRRVAPIRSRSFIRLGPYWMEADSSLVKKSLWKTGGALLKYLVANLREEENKKQNICSSIPCLWFYTHSHKLSHFLTIKLGKSWDFSRLNIDFILPWLLRLKTFPWLSQSLFKGCGNPSATHLTWPWLTFEHLDWCLEVCLEPHTSAHGGHELT